MSRANWCIIWGQVRPESLQFCTTSTDQHAWKNFRSCERVGVTADAHGVSRASENMKTQQLIQHISLVGGLKLSFFIFPIISNWGGPILRIFFKVQPPFNHRSGHPKRLPRRQPDVSHLVTRVTNRVAAKVNFWWKSLLDPMRRLNLKIFSSWSWYFGVHAISRCV